MTDETNQIAPPLSIIEWLLQQALDLLDATGQSEAAIFANNALEIVRDNYSSADLTLD